MLSAALVAALTGTAVHGVTSHSALSASRSWITPSKGAFGLVNQVSRGGATTAEEQEESKEEGENVDLYLPGLLETTISKTKKVSAIVVVFL